MKIGAKYSHLNGLEWLMVHHPNYWAEIQDTIKSVDATKLKTKISKEKTMPGKLLYSPGDLNAAFKHELTNRGWGTPSRRNYFVTDDPTLMSATLGKSPKEQKQIIEAAGKEAIPTFNEADFAKGRVSVEVQFGKYSFVQFDLFVKHAADYMQNRIDLGIEIVPMKSMEKDMSSGPPFYEKHLHEILRQGRIFPPVPLLLIGIEP